MRAFWLIVSIGFYVMAGVNTARDIGRVNGVAGGLGEFIMVVALWPLLWAVRLGAQGARATRRAVERRRIER